MWPAQSCKSNGCAGTLSNGKATCKRNFAGCTCLPSVNTPGFDCVKAQSCESNNCGGTFSNGKATCKRAFSGCTCLPSTKTSGFTCGNPQSCESNNCNGKVSSNAATCQNAFAGCTCTPSPKTPGFCGLLTDCFATNCQGTLTPGDKLGRCQAQTHKGCPCLPNANTPGFCPTAGDCAAANCQGTTVGAGSSIGKCQTGSLKGCTCLVKTTHDDPFPPPSQPCEQDCTAMLSEKINNLPDRICTSDASNNFIDQGHSTSGFVDWFRLASHNNCFFTLAKPSAQVGFKDAYCLAKSDVVSWINQNALGCNVGDAFYRASAPLRPTAVNSGQGQVCLSDFGNYQGRGSSRLNGATPVN